MDYGVFQTEKDHRRGRKDDHGHGHSHRHHRNGPRHHHRHRNHRNHLRDRDPHIDNSHGDDTTEGSSSSGGCRYWKGRQKTKENRHLERERTLLINQWKAEALAEYEAMRRAEEEARWYNRLHRWGKKNAKAVMGYSKSFLAKAEAVVSNMPLTIGAVALAVVTLGVVWFKFAEENIDSCVSVHFHSEQCTFPEFPGCFYCDKSNRWYQIAEKFHFTCSAVGGALAAVFFAKVVLARKVVIDELSSPTTASPAGLICMTIVCVFAGRGAVGEILVLSAASVHLCLAAWFIYMALAYRILPDPSWYPNTVGIGLSAVKTWLYFPMGGNILMVICLSLNIFFFPVSVIRVTMNKKISAPVSWIQMSAPAVTLYAVTIMAQPTVREEDLDLTSFERLHRSVYLPCMTFLFLLSLIGIASSLQSLYARWDNFRYKRFSPAHAAFGFPLLAHANAIQAYRGAIDSFSKVPPHSAIKVVIYAYWLTCLLAGTVSTVYVTVKFFAHIPSWTLMDVDEEEEEPPAPNETVMVAEEGIFAGETMVQTFVSPAVLQANETGVLVALPRGTSYRGQRFRRTRKVTALGFEPIMNLMELAEERDALLEMVAKKPPRMRRQTLSVPGIDFQYGYGDFGIGNVGVYGGSGGGRGPGAPPGGDPRNFGAGSSGRQRAETDTGQYGNREDAHWNLLR